MDGKDAFAECDGIFTDIPNEKVISLMTATRISLKEVTKRTGFSSPQYFSHAYHEFYGRPPVSDRRAK